MCGLLLFPPAYFEKSAPDLAVQDGGVATNPSYTRHGTFFLFELVNQVHGILNRLGIYHLLALFSQQVGWVLNSKGGIINCNGEPVIGRLQVESLLLVLFFSRLMVLDCVAPSWESRQSPSLGCLYQKARECPSLLYSYGDYR